jgi:cell division initiation protein
MHLSPEMIREQRFKVKLSGFDKNEVTAFLLDIAEDMDKLIEENRLLKNEVESVQRRQKDLEDLFLSVKQFSEEKMKRADIDARVLIADAEKKASEIQRISNQKYMEAEQKAQEMLAEVTQRAREILKEAEKAKADLEGGLMELKDRKASLFSEFKAILESYQGWMREQVHVD